MTLIQNLQLRSRKQPIKKKKKKHSIVFQRASRRDATNRKPEPIGKRRQIGNVRARKSGSGTEGTVGYPITRTEASGNRWIISAVRQNTPMAKQG